MDKIRAIIYDFDGTLTPDVCPKFAILEKSGLEGGCENPTFFQNVHELAHHDHIDVYDAMIRHILTIIRSAGYRLTDENIALGADQRIYRPGVPEFLRAVKTSGVKNYLLSSGSKAYLEHTVISPCFSAIFASTLRYDANGEAIAPDHVMSAEAKTDTLRKIAESTTGSPEDCSGVVYIGDGPTDVPVMTYVKKHGGTTIMVCDEQNQDEVDRLYAVAGQKHDSVDDVVCHFFPADFRKTSELGCFITSQML